MGKHGEQYASLLVVAALEFGDQFSVAELRTALNALPNKGLAEAAKTLARSLNAADDRRAEYWVHRVEPLIKKVWPKSAAKGQAMSLRHSWKFASILILTLQKPVI